MKRILLLLSMSLISQLGFATNTTPTTGYENGHEWVDLGLPSGTLWATCNIGASSPEEYGDYFSWGETSPKVEYSQSTLKYYVKGEVGLFTKYVPSNKPQRWSGSSSPDNKTTLELCDDAARANWGGNWQMPTELQWDELNNQCTWSWMGNGYRVTGPNGQSIILPAAGGRRDRSLNNAGANGFYWSSSIRKENPYNAWLLILKDISHIVGAFHRGFGFSVRAVTEKENKLSTEKPVPQPSGVSTIGYDSGHEWVDLGLPSGTKWATCNVGASSPREYGDYYAWGETCTKTEYTWENYRFRTGGDSKENVRLSKYNTWKNYGPVDNRLQLELSDDVAHISWGGNWRIPTEEQWEELKKNCTWYKVTTGFMRGVGPNGQTIILPAAGERKGNSSIYGGSVGNYWSSTIHRYFSYDAMLFQVAEGKGYGIFATDRCEGLSIRPVTQ